MTRHVWYAVAAALVWTALAFIGPTIVRAQADAVRNELLAVGSLKPSGVVAVTIDGEPVDVSQVNVMMKKSLHDRPVSKAALPTLEAQALDEVINRELVRNFLRDKKIPVSEDEVDKEIEARAKSSRQQKIELADVRGLSELTMDDFREDVAADLRWAKYARSLINDEEIEKYFDAHRKDLDGTELRVSHIILRPDGPLDPEQNDALSRRADTIRDEIIGELSSFADAAKKYSNGPSRKTGGDIGFIPRHGLMPEEFAAAAFKLDKGEISKAVVTPLGVHLIQWTEIHPGKKTWRDLQRELRPLVMQELFNRIATKMREKANIEYSTEVSHFRPDNGQLVVGVLEPTNSAATEAK